MQDVTHVNSYNAKQIITTCIHSAKWFMDLLKLNVRTSRTKTTGAKFEKKCYPAHGSVGCLVCFFPISMLGLIHRLGFTKELTIIVGASQS